MVICPRSWSGVNPSLVLTNTTSNWKEEIINKSHQSNSYNHVKDLNNVQISWVTQLLDSYNESLCIVHDNSEGTHTAMTPHVSAPQLTDT